MLSIMLVVTAFGFVYTFPLVPVGNAVLAVYVPLIVILADKAGINPMWYLVLILGYTSKFFLFPDLRLVAARLHHRFGIWKRCFWIHIWGQSAVSGEPSHYISGRHSTGYQPGYPNQGRHHPFQESFRICMPVRLTMIHTILATAGQSGGSP